MIENYIISKTIQEDPDLVNQAIFANFCFSIRKKISKKLCVREYKKPYRGFYYVKNTREFYKTPYSYPNTKKVKLTRKAAKIVMENWNSLSDEEKAYYEKEAKKIDKTWKGHNLYFKLFYREIYESLSKGWGQSPWGVSGYGS